MSKIQVDNIVNKDDNGAPSFPFGVTGTDASMSPAQSGGSGIVIVRYRV